MEILKVGWRCLACAEAYANASLGRRDIIGPMSLLPGARLGPYEVHSALGAGGMGEVYRARDTKLGRDVALKIIPESWASDPDRLARFQREAQMLATFSSTGVFAYAQGSFGHRRLVWVDRTGKEVGIIGEPDDSGIANPELTIDGTRLAVTRLTPGPNVWIFDTARGVPTPLTIGPGNRHAPFWSPRGDRILFRSQTRGGGMQRLFVKPANGLSDAVPLFESQVSMTPSGWSPDGRFALYVVPGENLSHVQLASDAQAMTSRTYGKGVESCSVLS